MQDQEEFEQVSIEFIENDESFEIKIESHDDLVNLTMSNLQSDIIIEEEVTELPYVDEDVESHESLISSDAEIINDNVDLNRDENIDKSEESLFSSDENTDKSEESLRPSDEQIVNESITNDGFCVDDETNRKHRLHYYNYFHLHHNIDNKLPLIYSPYYNIKFLYLEKLHYFDSCKYERIVKFLVDDIKINNNDLITVSNIPYKSILETVHTNDYLNSLNYSANIARILELPLVQYIPPFLLRSFILTPFLYATSGTILAAYIALEKGCAINLGGGFHHASSNFGHGFCVFADISLSIHAIRQYTHVKKVMIIDLDAHQGDGHEKEKINNEDEDLYIIDAYHEGIFPNDRYSEKAIDCPILLNPRTTDNQYIILLHSALTTSFESFRPDIIYYNAGTDIIKGDSQGCLNLSEDTVVLRDQIVFEKAFENKIPIVMTLSGGYQYSNARTIANSLINLNNKFDILKVNK